LVGCEDEEKIRRERESKREKEGGGKRVGGREGELCLLCLIRKIIDSFLYTPPPYSAAGAPLSFSLLTSPLNSLKSYSGYIAWYMYIVHVQFKTP